MCLDQGVERHLNDQVGVELGEEGERVADAFGALVAVPQRRDERLHVSVGAQPANEQERLLFIGGRQIVIGHWTRALPVSRREGCIRLAERLPIRVECGGRRLQAGEGQPHDEREPTALPAISLLDVLPEIAPTIPPADRELAERALMVPRLLARDVDLAMTLAHTGEDGFDFLIVEGIVLKETRLSNRAALELLGPGDVLGPPLNAIRQMESRAVSRYVAHGAVTLAELGARFRAAARRWPGLSDVLLDRLARQTHQASMHLAMLHLSRIEDRVVALFSDLAERFGHMTSEGAIIDLDLTHEVIGRLVGSRRSTVTLALQDLAAHGTLDRRTDGRWVLDPNAIAP